MRKTMQKWFRPSFECLEDRTAPAIFGVTNTNDAGAGSLRQAIVDLNLVQDNVNSIRFQNANGIISLSSALDVIRKNVDIIGPGRNVLNVARRGGANDPAFRIFGIGAGTIVTISGLTISNGRLTDVNSSGGGVANWGTLTLSEVTVSGNSASFPEILESPETMPNMVAASSIGRG